MATGDARVVDPLDTVHHEMGSVVRSHHAYKSVWSPCNRITTHPG